MGQPSVLARYSGFALADPLIESLGAADFIGSGLDPHRLETDHPAAVEYRCDVGVDPIMVAVLRAVLDDAHPGQALFERAPHVREYGRRYVGVTHDVLGRTDQIVTFKAADFDKGIVAVSDHALHIGGGDEFLLRREGNLALCYGLIVAHSDYSLVAPTPSAASHKKLIFIWQLIRRWSKA